MVLLFFVYSQKVGRRFEHEHHQSKRDRCGLLSWLCAVIFSSHRRSSIGHVPLLVRSHVACVSNPRNSQKLYISDGTDKRELLGGASRWTAVELDGQLTVISAHLSHKGRKLEV